MSYVNGHGQELSLSEGIAAVAVSGSHSVQMSPERLNKIRELLNEPFDPGEIKWRVTATSTQQTKHGPQKRGQLVAYADQRAYTDRLNEVFGEWGWTRDYDVQVAQNFERRAPGDKKETAVAAKVVVVSKVTSSGKQVTDRYLLGLARRNGGKVATFDRALAAFGGSDVICLLPAHK